MLCLLAERFALTLMSALLVIAESAPALKIPVVFIWNKSPLALAYTIQVATDLPPCWGLFPPVTPPVCSIPTPNSTSKSCFSGNNWKEYVRYYNTQRTHLGIRKDSPEPREVQAEGEIDKVPVVNGLHHFYFRRAA
jgi:hypothetical protein